MATFSVLLSPTSVLTATDMMNQMILLELEILSFYDGTFVTHGFLFHVILNFL